MIKVAAFQLGWRDNTEDESAIERDSSCTLKLKRTKIHDKHNTVVSRSLNLTAL